jgi:hypothetical protein
MGDLIPKNTDDEMERYNEADMIRRARIPMENNAALVYEVDPVSKREVALFPLSSGGYVKIGDRAVTPAQAAETDVLAAQATVQNDGRTPIGMVMGGADGPTMEDYEAAGFTEAEVTQFQAQNRAEVLSQPGVQVPVQLTPEQVQMGVDVGAPMLTTRDATKREGATEFLAGAGDGAASQFLKDVYEAIGLDEFEARRLAEAVIGNPNSTRDFGFGLADLTPAGIIFGAEEGYNTFQRGLSTDDPLTAGLGALEAGLSVLEAAPMVGAGVRGLRELATPAMREAINTLRADAIGTGRAIMQGDTEMLGEVFQPSGTARSLGAAGTGDLVSPPEKTLIESAVPTESAEAVQNQIASQKSNYPAQDGWAQDVMQVTRVEPKRNNFEVTYKEVPYNFEKPPEGVDAQQWASTIATRVVDEIRQLATRVSNGDAAAKAILEQANWYRSMRSSMRREFGGMGDVFADLLGTTSAQTGVEMNWNNAIEVMRRFSRGEYDEEIRMYQEMLDKGDVNPTKLQQLHKDPNSPFRLITNAAGSLFNANSPAATKALFDMFRVAGGSPKTPNFTGNLIGYTNAATIDVWAARFLRRLAGLNRLPPPVEKGVTGSHLSGSTLEKPRVGGEFGFGQRVLEDAARQVNEQQIIRSIAPNLADMNPDDLQAVAWFIEKEKWATNGWTTKAGEGGSFEFEASLAGAADPANVSALRRQINQGFAAPKRLKKETDAEYEARVAQAQSEYGQAKTQAQADLNDAKAPLARYVLGISVERPGARPTNVQQAEVSARLGEPAKADPSVVMYQVNNTYGRFMQSDERAFNAEFVVRKNFDPAGVTRRMVEVAREADQDAAFISKVVPDRTPDSRPGVEIYFRNRQPPNFARNLSDKLTQYGVDGFTFVTDSRVMDRPSVQAGMAEEAVAGINGLRFQYIPEFDIGRDAWAAMSPTEKAQKIDEVEELFERIVNDLVEEDASISAVNLMNYETTVIEREDYDEYLR